MANESQICVGPDEWPVIIPAGKLVPLLTSQTSSAKRSARELVRNALENPYRFEAVRRAMTPDDHIVIVVDDALPCLAELIAGVVEYVGDAGVKPDAVTLLLAPPAWHQEFVDDLPDEIADVKV